MRHAERWRARDRETAFAARTLRQSTPKRAAQHLAGVAVNPRCSMWLVAFLGVCALSLCRCQRVEIRAYAACCFPVRMYTLYPEVRGTDFVCMRVLKLQQQQHRTTIPPPAAAAASARWSQILAPQRANPTLAVGWTCSFKVHTAPVPLLSLIHI